MVKSLYSGVSGLKTHQQRMDVVGNNIANVNTVGNKVDVVTFKDVYYQTKRSASGATSTLGGVNPRQVGYGVQMNTTSANMSQSGYTQSDNIYDMAINGNGFFQVMDGAGNIFYTRAGIFNIDSEGYLVNADGYHVLGISGNSEGQAPGSEIIRCVIPATDAHASSATKQINGTNVTLSMSAPSKNTNISVAFVDSTYPYATFANSILTVYFNREKQYESENAFEDAINTALQAGGVTLPDDCELQFNFENIPSDPNSKTAANSVDEGFEYTTSNASCEFVSSFTDPGATTKKYAYMSFAVDDNACTDKVVIHKIPDSQATAVTYDSTKKQWILSLNKDVTYSELSSKIKDYIRDHSEATNLSVTSFQFPDGANKDDILSKWATQTGDDADITKIAATAGMQLVGAVEGNSNSNGAFDLEATVPGAYANDYKVVFTYLDGYDKTSATWDDNTLTVSICANSTVTDVNRVIKEVANGNEKRVLRFNNISGLDYGRDIEITDGTGLKNGVGNVDIRMTYANGITYEGTVKLPEVEKNDIVGTALTGKETFRSVNFSTENGKLVRTVIFDVEDGGANVGTNTYVTEIAINPTGNTGWKDKKGNELSAMPDNLPVDKSGSDIWNPGLRKAFFSGLPQIAPTDGKDSFFTGVAKSLSTFNLENGRINEAQSYDDFTDVTVQRDGRIIGLHPVHGYVEIGRIDLATFDNPNGLAKVGGTMFQETVASGPAQIGAPSTGGTGEVLSGTLEMSNVDLADEFTNMITTQRGYQANSRVITVSDTMIEELLSLKR